MERRWIDNENIDFTGRPVHNYTAQGGYSPEGLRVEHALHGPGTITDGPHTTYSATVRFDATGNSHYIATDKLTFLGDGRGGALEAAEEEA